MIHTSRLAGLPDVWMASAEEVARAYACDDLVREPAARLLRGVTSSAAPQDVYRWLCQLRFAPYSYDWVDNWGRRSPRHLTPGGQNLVVGQPVMTIFTLDSFINDQELTIKINDGAALAAFGHVAVTYRVDASLGGTRLVAVVRVADLPGSLSRARRRLLAWGDLLMMRKQLTTLVALAERGC